MEYRPRIEAHLREEDIDWGTSHRARASISAETNDLSVMFSLQDVRTWGEETNTLKDFDADNMDLHEAYLQWAVNDSLQLKAGRQEIKVHEHRLLGNVGWTQQGRSFDGLRVSHKSGAISADLYAAITANLPPVDPATETTRGDMEALRAGWSNKTAQADVLVIRDNRFDDSSDTLTAGAYAKGTKGLLTGRLEGYGQWSKAGVAHMLGAAVTMAPEVSLKPKVTLWFDRLSGEKDNAPAFNTLYATNHKFYGTADIAAFSVGAMKDGQGLHDAALKLSLTPGETVLLSLDAHLFSTGNAALKPIGQEADFSAKLKLGDGLGLSGGVSAFLPSENGEMISWGWLQLASKI